MCLPVERDSGDAGWFVFHPFENERYDRQRRFSDYTLFAARDGMCEHVDTLYSEIEMREITREFAQAISETAEMLRGFDRQDITMPKVFEKLRKIMEPLHSEERLRKYDELYKQLVEMYPSESQSTDSISDEWLESVVAGRISWDAVPEMNVQPQPAQEPAKAQTVSKAEDFHSMMDSLSSTLKGED